MTTATDNWFRCPVPTTDGAVDIYLDQAGRWFMESEFGPDRQDWETALLMIPLASRELPKQAAEDHFAELLRDIAGDLDSENGPSSAEWRSGLERLGEVLPQLRDWLVAVERLPAASGEVTDKLVEFVAKIFAFEGDRFLFSLRANHGWGEMKPDPEVPETDFRTIDCSLSDAVDFTDGSSSTMAPLLEAHDELLGLLVDLVVATLHRIRAGVVLESSEFDRFTAAAALALELAGERSDVA